MGSRQLENLFNYQFALAKRGVQSRLDHSLDQDLTAPPNQQPDQEINKEAFSLFWKITLYSTPSLCYATRDNFMATDPTSPTNSDRIDGAETTTRLVRTLLSRKPRASAAFVILLFWFLLALGACADWLNWKGAANWMPANQNLVFSQGQYWRLITGQFVHADLGHLLANSFMFLVLGYFLYGYFGPLLFPGLALALSILSKALILLTYPPDNYLVGASGLVYVMGGLWLSLYLFIARDVRFTLRMVRAFGVMLGLFFPSDFIANISYRSHFLGLGFGVVGGCLYFIARRTYFRSFEVYHTEIIVPHPLDEEALAADPTERM